MKYFFAFEHSVSTEHIEQSSLLGTVSTDRLLCAEFVRPSAVSLLYIVNRTPLPTHHNNATVDRFHSTDRSQEIQVLVVIMWSRIVNRSSYSVVSRSFQQKHANTAPLPCLFESILRRADSPSSSLHVHPSMMIERQKHSQTQIKRLFKRNPARLRVEKRMWNIDRKQPKVLLPTDPSQLTTRTIPTVDSTSTTNTATEQQLSEDVTTAMPLNGSHDAESVPPPSLLYPPVYTIPTILPNGWFPPMDPALRPNYPFSVRRTMNKPKDSVGFLPIYTKYRYVQCQHPMNDGGGEWLL